MVTAEIASDGNASFLRAARAGNLEKVLEYLKGNVDINTSNANGLNALHLASKEGHVYVVTELLKKGANVNAATKKGNTALHIASLAGQDEVVRVLVNLGANVNAQSQNGFTPLYMAAQENHDNVVSFLLSNGANQSLSTEDGFTPLAVALQQGHDRVVAVLLENDTKGKVRLPALHIAAKKDDCKAAALLLQNDHNPDVTSKSGFTPLHISAHYGNENVGNILMDKGADVNYAAKHQITPLHVASKWGKSNMVGLLVAKGANIEASTRDGLTPLHCAARSGHDQVVDLLLEKGAPILAKTKNGLAPLHMASQGDHVDSARILLYHKAPVDDVTVDYLTALHVAAHCGHVKVAKLLLDRKADPNARALNGFTPLHIACKKNRIKVVELLLKHGASIEATTESGLTPLHVASFMGCMNIVIYLIQNGANPDVPTVRGETPLHLAARANQTDIIRILLRNGASVDARAREDQTPLHIASRLGNVDIVSLLLQHGAAVDATTKDLYTALHIAAKEDQEEVSSVLLDHGASLVSTTKKGFTPLHLAAKYGNIKVARLLLQKDAPVDAQGKNGVTPLHVAAHYDHVNVALLLLDKGASPHAKAKNGYTPLHIAAKKNQMDIATTLLEYGAESNIESKAGFIPLHLASQEGHTDISNLLIEHNGDVNHKANNGLTPLHLCAQNDRVNVGTILVENGAEIAPQTKAGYTPLHVASHFGQINMVKFLLQQNANVDITTALGYTPLHQAAQQGHTLAVNLLLENEASPNVLTSQGQTPLSIAQRLGYISVVETLKVVTETTVTTTTTTVTEEKYKVVAPETMQETFMTDSEDEGGEDTMLGDQSYRYLTADEMKSLGDDSLPMDVTKDERQYETMHMVKESTAPVVEEDNLSPQHIAPVEMGFSEKYSPDNIDISHTPVHAGRLKWKTFLVSFMVDARGGAMRGCRHSGVRVIIPPRKASMPMRITCRYLRKEKLIHPPPLMEGEACASRILEVGPVGARFLGPVIIEVPHFASLRGKEREIIILRSDSGETWREHTFEASDEAVRDVLNESFEGEEFSALEDLNTSRITRILTTDFPQYFAIITRIRQEVHSVGPEGGIVSSTVVPQVQTIFPEGALTKKIRVGLQAQPIAPELVAKLLGNRVAVSPVVTVEPRRRKFHKPITLTIPVPQAATKGMINQYSGDAPTLRLLCSITGSTKSGGSSKAQWEDVTGSTPLTFVNDCVSFTTTVSARFWLMDCRQVSEASKFATELYQEAVHVPFMSKFVIFAKRNDPNEAHLRVFCMTDDKEDKTLETQEHFTEIAKSRDVEVLEGKLQYLEFAGNLVPITKSGEQLRLTFQAFHENRIPFMIRVKDPHVEPMGRIAFMREPKVGRGEPPQVPICNLNVALPEVVMADIAPAGLELVTLEKKDDFIHESGLSKPEAIHRADLRLSDIARELDKDWMDLAQQLEVSESDISMAKSENPDDACDQGLAMLRIWLQKAGAKGTGNELEKALRKICREDIIRKCMINVELVTDDVEKAVAKVQLDQSGFDVFKEELGSSREASMRRGASLDVSYDEQDVMKDAESAAETSSETGSIFEREQISQVFSDDKESMIRRVSKTPPPSPEEVSEKSVEYKEAKSKVEEKAVGNEVPDSHEVIVKQVQTVVIKSSDLVDVAAVATDLQEVNPKMTESETWPSGEMDTSQVSVSSLPDDEKSEPTTATVSSATAAEPDTGARTEEIREWTEVDESGTVKHIIHKTTHMTLSMQQKQDDSSDIEAGTISPIPDLETAVEPGSILMLSSEDASAVIDQTASPESPQLSFAEKRDFFHKLSVSSSSPSVTPSSTLKSTAVEEVEAHPLISEDTVSPVEQLSFAERLKFFEKTTDAPEHPSDSLTEIKTEVWTIKNEVDVIQTSVDSISEMVGHQFPDSGVSDETCDNEITKSIPKATDSISLGETLVETKVEVLVKHLEPGREAIEICSVENILDEKRIEIVENILVEDRTEILDNISDEKETDIAEQGEVIFDSRAFFGVEKSEKTSMQNESSTGISDEAKVCEDEFVAETALSDLVDNANVSTTLITSTVTLDTDIKCAYDVGHVELSESIEIEAIAVEEESGSILESESLVKPKLKKPSPIKETPDSFNKVDDGMSESSSEAQIEVPLNDKLPPVVFTTADITDVVEIENEYCSVDTDEMLKPSELLVEEETSDNFESLSSTELTIKTSSPEKETAKNDEKAGRDLVEDFFQDEVTLPVSVCNEMVASELTSVMGTELKYDVNTDKLSKPKPIARKLLSDEEYASDVFESEGSTELVIKTSSLEKGTSDSSHKEELNIDLCHSNEDEKFHVMDNKDFEIDDDFIEKIVSSGEERSPDNVEDGSASSVTSLTLETVKVFTYKEGTVNVMGEDTDFHDSFNGKFTHDVDSRIISEGHMTEPEGMESSQIVIKSSSDTKLQESAIDFHEESSIEKQSDSFQSPLAMEIEVGMIKSFNIELVDHSPKEEVDIKVESMIESLKASIETQRLPPSDTDGEETTEKSRQAFKLDYSSKVEKPESQNEQSSSTGEIFICTEQTLDNVKMILSAAEAESSIVLPNIDAYPCNESDVSTKEDEISEFPEIVGELCEDMEKSQEEIADVTELKYQEEVKELVESPEKIKEVSEISTLKYEKEEKESLGNETADITESKYQEEEKELLKSPESTDSRSEFSLSASVADRSFEVNNVEIVPVLEVSEEVSEVSVDMTGHEALGTSCSFHKETTSDDHIAEESESVLSDDIKSKAEFSYDLVEKADFEDVEKKILNDTDNKIEVAEEVFQKICADGNRKEKETWESVEITHHKELSKDVYSIPTSKVTTKISCKERQFEKDTCDYPVTLHKLDDFLKSVTQADHSNEEPSFSSNMEGMGTRTEEWVNKSGADLLKDSSVKDYHIEGIENGLCEEQAHTLDDEFHKRSSPTAESFDDEARVERCDTDVMMQLLDYVSRSDIELAEVRTEDEAPDIEEDVSPSAEEESPNKTLHEDSKPTDKKIEELVPDTTDHLHTLLPSKESVTIEPDDDNLLLSPLRSSFDSVTSPSRKDADVTAREIKPVEMYQRATEIKDEDKFVSIDIDQAVGNQNIHWDEACAGKPSGKMPPDSAETKMDDVIESEHVPHDVKMPGEQSVDSEDKLFQLPEESLPIKLSGEVKAHLYSTEESTVHQSSVLLSEEKISTVISEDVSDLHKVHGITTLLSESVSVDLAPKTGETTYEIEQLPKGSASVGSEQFVALGFDNTGFVGAELIDASEESIEFRSRSPYEVFRDDQDVEQDSNKLEKQIESVMQETGQTTNSPDSISCSPKSFSFSSDELFHFSGDKGSAEAIHREIRRRPILQQIPSEISEEDLVEREIGSPDLKEECSTSELKNEDFSERTHAAICVANLEYVNNVLDYDILGDNHLHVTVLSEPEDNVYSETDVKELSEYCFDNQIPLSGPTCKPSLEEAVVDKIISKRSDGTLEDKTCGENVKGGTDSVMENIYKLQDLESDKINVSTDDNRAPYEESNIPQINGPGEVDYKSEYDDDDDYKASTDYFSERIDSTILTDEMTVFSAGAASKITVASPSMVEEDSVQTDAQKSTVLKLSKVTESGVPDIESGKLICFGSVSDDTVDAEIGNILSLETQIEDDIIERPLTPEPPEEIHVFGAGVVPFCEMATQAFREEIGHSVDRSEFQPSSDLHKSHFEAVKDKDVGASAAPISDVLGETLHSYTHSTSYDIVEKETVEFFQHYPVEGMSHEQKKDFSWPVVSLTENLTLTNICAMKSDASIHSESPGFVYDMHFEQDIGEQTEEAMDIDSDQCSEEKDHSYTYGMRFEREQDLDEDEDDIPGYGDLYTHQEEDEDVIDESDKDKMPYSSPKTDKHVKQSGQDFDTLAGRRFFSKNGDLDDLSVSSLQEFERLEEEIVSGRKSSIGSVESFNGKPIHSKSGEHDDVSMNSLTEFEKLERECAEAERAEAVSFEMDAHLSEIEEGHESQASEASQETMLDIEKDDDLNEPTDYDDSLIIDKVIQTSQTGIENLNEISSTKYFVSASHHLDEKSDTFSDDSMSASATVTTIKRVEGPFSIVTEASIESTIKTTLTEGSHLSKSSFTAPEKKHVVRLPCLTSDRPLCIIDNKSNDAKDLKMLIFEHTKRDDGDVDQDSLHEDQSMKPDSLSGEEKHDYQDSLLEDKSGEFDSLQDETRDEMKDSLHEERPIDEDSLHEMEMPLDESSLSMESSFAAAVGLPHDSNRADFCEVASEQLTAVKGDTDSDSLKSLNLGLALESAFASHIHDIAVSDIDRGGDIMISSTDSLEHSSSAATHATYQFETESVMSSSINSVPTSDDFTMISSTDALEPDIKFSSSYANLSIADIEALVKSGKRKIFLDSEGNIQEGDSGLFTDLEGNLQRILMPQSEIPVHEIKSPCSLSSVQSYTATVTSPDEMSYTQSSIQFDTGKLKSSDPYFYSEEMTEQKRLSSEDEGISVISEKDNPKVIRRIKQISPRIPGISDTESPPDGMEEKFKEFLRTHAGSSEAGKCEEELQEERTVDEKGNTVIVRTVKRQFVSKPEVYSESFAGTEAEKYSKEFIESFKLNATETEDQFEKVDADGNVIRVTQQVILKPVMQTVSFSGPDAHKQMEEYMKHWSEQESCEKTTVVSSGITSLESFQASGSFQNQHSTTGATLLSDLSRDYDILPDHALSEVRTTTVQHPASGDIAAGRIPLESTQEKQSSEKCLDSSSDQASSETNLVKLSQDNEDYIYKNGSSHSPHSDIQ